MSFLSLNHRNKRNFRELPSSLQQVAGFYIPISKKEGADIQAAQKAHAKFMKKADIRLTSEEIVEDAGLNDDTVRHGHTGKNTMEVTQWA